MAKILGLDLGTNSIGWALIDEEKHNSKLLDKGVLIFSEGVKSEKGIEKSKAAERTSYRSARKLKFRRKLRKYETLLVLSKNRMCPLTVEEVIAWRKTGFKDYPTNPAFLNWLKTDDETNKNPYYFRDQASQVKIDPMDIGRAFYHLAQRRGFLSNRLDQSDIGVIEKHRPELETIIDSSQNTAELKTGIEDYYEGFDILDKPTKDLSAGETELKRLYNVLMKVLTQNTDIVSVRKLLLEPLNKKENLGTVKNGISELDEEIKLADCKTLGQYFWKLYQDDRNVVKNKIRTRYTSRENQYLHEFEWICNVQGFPSINPNEINPSKRYSGLTLDLYKAIFFQRPLKSQKGTIGKCTLEPTKTRSQISRPHYEEFRMYQFINGIKIKTRTDEVFRQLNRDEIDRITSLFFRKTKPTFVFRDIITVLGTEHEYNYNKNASVSGCPTIASLRLIFGGNWDEEMYRRYTKKEIKDRKTGEITGTKNVDQVVEDVWHVLNTFTSDDKLISFAKDQLGLDESKARQFSRTQLKKDYGSLSIKAVKNILPYLKKDGLIYSHAVFMGNLHAMIKPERWNNIEDREFIQREIQKIIENDRMDRRIATVLNGYLTGERGNYSAQAESIFRSELNSRFESHFGRNTWEQLNDRDLLFSEAFQTFLKYQRAGKNIPIQRLDEKILGLLSDNDLLSPNSQGMLYHPSDTEQFILAEIRSLDGIKMEGLGTPETGSIKNPMAIRTLHKLKKLINTLISEGIIDEGTKVNVELARELNDANKRKAIKAWQEDKRKLREGYEQKIKELYLAKTGNEIEPTTDDLDKFQMALEQRKDGIIVGSDELLKYQLWDEQNHVCLYTGKTIGIESFLGNQPRFDIEHTIPRSASWDNSQMNKTLAESRFNRETKGSKIPSELSNHDEILRRIEHWKLRYEELSDQIQKLMRTTKGATDKEHKDRLIQKRHYLTLERDYWKGKHDRFITEEISSGFKNSQAVDTGIITKYALRYMKSYFKRVYSVKGEMVDQCRKAWGLHESVINENGKMRYLPKDRSNHTHHCKDAVTIACMNKNLYDELARAWSMEDKGEFAKARTILQKSKPWGTFTEDVRNLDKEILVVHDSKDKMPIQTKKQWRKNGKIQKNKKGEVIYLQGDTARGSLHQETFYGAIKVPELDADGNYSHNESGNIIFKQDKKGVDEVTYVVRKKLDALSDAELSKIVDPLIREIAISSRKNEKEIKKRLETLKGLLKLDETTEKFIQEEKDLSHRLKNELYAIPPKEGKNIWTPIRKVRIHARLNEPLPEFKKHRDVSRHNHKRWLYVQNDENYCLALYENADKSKRAAEIVNNLNAAHYFRLSNGQERKKYPLVESDKKGMKLKGILQIGKLVLFYDKSPDEIWDLDLIERSKRLYRVRKMAKNGQVTFQYHQEARIDEDLKQWYQKTYHQEAPKSLTNGESKVDFERLPIAKLLLSPVGMKMLIEDVDFSITPTGKIQPIDH